MSSANGNPIAETLSVPSRNTPTNYGPFFISGSAKVHLGDIYKLNKDVFETGSAEEKRAAVLNILYYEGLDTKREQLISQDIGPESFSWVDQKTRFPQWLNTGETPFWIRGKPGSGKSTLMKYLAESRSTVDRLHHDGNRWTVVHFFFDYRAGQMMANQVLGMLKLFLRQLTLSIPQFQELLISQETRSTLLSDSVEKYIDVIANAVIASGHKICAFVDGLDEYEGDLWDLCTKLEILRDRAGLKLCLASRPEAAFETLLTKYPTITMQDYNKDSMKVYIQRKISKFLSLHPFVQHLFPATMQDAIADKAQGVVLWARLVVDEMVKSCDEDTTPSSLVAFLDSLPAQLEPLYERILGKMNMKYQKEAALVLHLIVEADRPTSAAVLYQAWAFIEGNELGTSLPHLVPNDGYESRVKALLGNMVDFVQPKGESVSIRLIHRSLSTYLIRYRWIQDRLARSHKEMYPDFLWRRLANRVLTQAAEEDAFDSSELEQHLQRYVQVPPEKLLDTLCVIDQHVDALRNRHTLNAMRRDFKQEWITSQTWPYQPELLLYCVEQVFDIDSRRYFAGAQHIDELHFPMKANKLALLHFLRCNDCLRYASGWWHLMRVVRLYADGFLSWVLHVVHACYAKAERDLVECIRSKRSTSPGEIQAIEDMLDLTFVHGGWKTKHRRVESTKLLKCFAAYGYWMDSRHLCSLHLTSAVVHELDKGLLEISQTRGEIPWLPVHDRDCPYTKEQVGLLHHWIQMQFIAIYEDDLVELEVFQTLGVNLNAPVYLDGTGPFHPVVSNSTYDNRGRLRRTFVALANHGVRPNVSGGRNDLLAYARSIRNKLWVRGVSRIGKFELSYLSFVEDCVQALKKYKAKNNQWPDLKFMT